MSPEPARSVYIAAPEGRTGRTLVALGVLDVLMRRVRRVGVFRPVARPGGPDPLLALLAARTDGLQEPAEAIGVTYDEVHADPEAALQTIVERHRGLAERFDALVIVGSDYTDVATPTELAFNARVAANLGAPVLLVVRALERSPQDVANLVDLAMDELEQAHASTVGVIANRVEPASVVGVAGVLAPLEVPSWVIPETPMLSAPLLADIVRALDGTLFAGDEALLEREAEELLVCAMNVEHVLDHLLDGQVCIAAGDRPDLVVALVAAHAAEGTPTLAGVVLNGGYEPSTKVAELIRGLDPHLPIVVTSHDTLQTAQLAAGTRARAGLTSQRKVDTALGLFEANVDARAVAAALEVPRSDVVTPLMFEAMLTERARADVKRIVLPEGDDERVLRAAASLLSRQIVEIVLLGDEARILGIAGSLGLDIDRARIIDPRRSPLVEPFAEEYARLRSHRGITLDVARDIVRDVSYFGTMLVQLGHADGMVSGAAHSTAHTITPSFEIIKTVPGTDVVSSVFFMALQDRVLVYGDCAVIPEPTVEQLADIAVSSAATAARFGIEPRIAMLSYSTGDSGAGVEVDRVRAATELVRRRRPELLVDGPLQYDAAVDAAVAAAKLPGSTVAGRATVFVFPDLNTGNNTYKAVQRTAGAVAIGPVLQGLRKPVNDLSRGATVRDIENTIAITAVQAQQGTPTGEQAT